MISLFKKNIEILLIFILSLTPIWWLRNGEIIIGHDSGFRLNYLEHLRNLSYSWNANHNFGSDWAILKGFLIIQAPESFFSFIFRSVWLGEIATFIFWFFIMGLSMYIAIKALFPEKEFALARIVGSIFYMYNFFILQGWFIAERAKFSLFAALPLGFLIIYKALNKQYSLLKSTIYFSILTFFLNGGGSPPLYGSLILTYAITFIFLTLINIRKNGATEIIYSIKLILCLFLGFFFINSYFILPQIYAALNSYSGMLSSIGGISGILAWERAINKYASILNLLRLQGIPDWYDNPSHVYANDFTTNPFLIVLSFIPILTILVGLSIIKISQLKEKSKVIFVLLAILLIGIIFASGSHPPFGFIYIFLVEHLPGFAIFRSAIYKFGPAFWMSVIFLFAIYLNLIVNKYIKNKKLYNLAIIGSTVFVLLFHFPYFTSNFFNFNNPFTTKVKIPEYIHETNSYLNNSTEETNVLLLPRLDPYYRVDSYEWGFWSLEPISKLSLNHPVISNDTVSPEIINEIYESDDPNYIDRILGRFGINKIILRKDIVYNDKKTKINELNSQAKTILENKNVSLDKKFGQWEIYNFNSSSYIPFVSSPEIVVSANVNKKYSKTILETQKDKKSLLVFNEPENNTNASLIEEISSKTYIEPECYLCQNREFEDQKNLVLINDANILPGSTFYKFKISKENKLRSRFRNGASEIDLSLSLANNRIAEYRSIVKNEKLPLAQKELNLKSLSANYKSEISNAIKLVKELNEIERNKYNVKIYSYLDSQIDYLKDKGFDLNIPENQNLESFIEKEKINLSKDIWYSTDQNKKLIVNINKEGNYLIGSFIDNREEIFLLDGKQITLNKYLNLSKGFHLLEIRRKYESDNTEIKLDVNKRIEVRHLGDGSNKDHILTFEYYTDRDTFLDLEINGKKLDKIAIELKHHAEPRVYTLKLGKGLDLDGSKVFLANNDNTNDSLRIKDVRLEEVYDPNIFLLKDGVSDGLGIPEITYKKINPTRTDIKIKNASSPYILTINNSFSPGWKIYEGNKNIISLFFSKNIFENNQIKSNGYSNSWYIDKNGDYELTVFYEPQKAFYIGGILSLLTLLIMVYLLLRMRGKK